MAFHIGHDVRRIVKVIETVDENQEIKTVYFKDKKCAHADPGQYAMLWIPGIDEVPMSISKTGPGSLCGVTVQRVGEATAAIHRLRKGDILGLRGPFGRGFTPRAVPSLLIAGGVGLAPLIPLAENLRKLGSKVTLAYGSKTGSMLYGLERLRSFLESRDIIIATEDGAVGFKGIITEVVAKLLEREAYGVVYTCGPEPMMRVVFELTESRGIPLQACLERVIKCSIGLCGSCMLGKFRVCKEGPVLTSEQLRLVLDEFGVYTRGLNGSRILY